jgi:hypothetical protein
MRNNRNLREKKWKCFIVIFSIENQNLFDISSNFKLKNFNHIKTGKIISFLNQAVEIAFIGRSQPNPDEVWNSSFFQIFLLIYLFKRIYF